jgi:molybdopterin converting factor small subunit
MRVQVELWLWLNKELGGDFQSPSEMRSVTEIDVENGATVKNLFDRLADRYPVIGQKVFNRQNGKFYPHLSVILTSMDEVISPYSGEDSVLKDGDRIKILPIYVGGQVNEGA